ncbi:MAG: glycine--tRNA ligase subunit beta [Thiotrichales bacterium]
MTARADLLLEIGTEELPPKALKTLMDSLADECGKGFAEAGLDYATLQGYAAPRRLALQVTGLLIRQPDKRIERRGPAVQAAFDGEGRPTQAALGFARACGVSMDQIKTVEQGKGRWLAFEAVQPGTDAAVLLPELVEQALNRLPIPKRMRWGAGTAEFVRPVHWIVLLLGDAVVPGTVLGLPTGRTTYGHRFHHPEPIEIPCPDAYSELLRIQGRVIVDFAQRRASIQEQVLRAANSVNGHAVIDPGLLNEVTALVEWPVALMGQFESRFLEVPQEALISTMQDNQKYFPVIDTAGRLMPCFITVANIESREPQRVIEGNERVIRPRFTDAAFFWNQDRKQPLEARLERLKGVTFQQRLGSLYEKTERLVALAGFMAPRIGADAAAAERAAWLAKCDLMTDMVFEFTELQGVAGRYYARHDGEAEAVANALDEQYQPRHAGDSLPTGALGQVLALADKLDTLMGIFAIGQKPTGAKDPYGLRRAALGVLRILIEGRLPLDLRDLLGAAANGLQGKAPAVEAIDECFDYILDRLKAYYQDQGVPPDVIDAVMALRPTVPLDFDQRIQAVNAFRQLPAATSLAAANKRIQNLLKKVDGAIAQAVREELLHEAPERALFDAVEALRAAVTAAFDAGRYTEALTRLADLREPVDAFFDQVMVMSDDAALRENRLALLSRLAQLFGRAADLSRLQ